MRAAPVDVTVQKKLGPVEYTGTRSWRHGRALISRTFALHIFGRYYMVTFTRTAPMPVRIIPK